MVSGRIRAMRKLALTLAALAAMLALAACQCERPIQTYQRPAAANPVRAQPPVSPDGTPALSPQPKTCPPEG